MTDLSVYVHIPFCVRKCLYCDFPSAPGTEAEMTAYVKQLREDIQKTGRADALSGNDFRVVSVFFGGGTPSLLRPEDLLSLLSAVRDSYDLAPDCEISLEANPGTVTRESLRAYRAGGFDRISLGVQSFDDGALRRLGRIHTAREAEEAFVFSREAGFENVNLDLISCLPGQSLKDLQKDLEKAASLRPEHLSVYSLIIEEGTPFFDLYAGRPELLPDEDEQLSMDRMTRDILRRAGYRRYEISNYALPGRECRHNRGYWEGRYYRGFGRGAASYMPGPEGPERFYWPGRKDRILLSEEDRMEEFFFLGLRETDGVSRQEFFDRFGTSVRDVYGDVTARLTCQGLLKEESGRISLTERGTEVANGVFASFLLDKETK